MKKAGVVTVIVLLACASLVLPGGWGCGGGETGDGDGDGDAATAQEQFTAATASLESGDITSARDQYDAAAAIPTTAPSITVDLNHLFTDPPSADSIGIDPFVLEGGKIKGVEAFFNQMMEDVVFGITLPVDSFEILNTTLSGKAVRNAVFNEFVSFPPFN